MSTPGSVQETLGILTIEDDPAIRRGIVDSLKASGYTVWQAGRAEAGIDLAFSRPCDLVLLDLVLPGADGLDVLRQIRSEKPTLPVIILTARGEENDRVRGLKLGADDYVVKPFSVDELLARVEAVLRRSPGRPQPATQLKLPCGSVDWASREVVSKEGERHSLSEREAALLAYLAKHPGRAIPRDELLRGVWQIDAKGVSTRTVDMHVARVREKLLVCSEGEELIKTIRGKGYLLNERFIHRESDTDGES